MKDEKPALETVEHDINSTIMSIKAYTQLLLRKTKPTLDEVTYEYIVRLDMQIDSLIDLILQQNKENKNKKK